MRRFDCRDFPHPCPQTLLGTTLQENATVRARDDHCVVMHRLLPGTGPGQRDPLLTACPTGHAQRSQRAVAATWSGGRAENRSEFHQSFIEDARSPARRDKPLSDAPRRRIAAAVFQREQAGKHPRDVSVDDRFALPEHNGGDCPRGVSPHAGQRLKRGRLGGNIAAVVGGNRPRCGMQQPRPPVISKPLPGRHHFIIARCGEFLNAWEPSEE